MTCRSCASDYHTEVEAEINLHFPKSDGLGYADMLIFRPVLLCLHCGLAEFTIADQELKRPAAGDSS